MSIKGVVIGSPQGSEYISIFSGYTSDGKKIFVNVDNNKFTINNRKVSSREVLNILKEHNCENYDVLRLSMFNNI